jgi:hypothetical protein
MPKRSSKNKPRDINQLAAAIVDEATRDQPPEGKTPQPQEPEKPGKNPAAVELGRLGGKKGGLARAASLTPEQRSEIARRAAEKRWQRK